MKIHVIVKPNSPKTEVIFVRDGQFRVLVTAPPSHNQANEAVIAALAKHFRIAKSLITIVRGARTKSKTIEILIDRELL